MMAVHPKRLDSIQALRGIAAMLVLFFHIAEFQRQIVGENSTDLQFISGIWDGGWAGVDLFFVISGFIMVYVTQNTGRSLRDIRHFVWSRVTRIYPLWWVCCGVLISYFLITFGLPEATDRVTDAREAWIYAFKSLALIPQERLPILTLGWTLIHELFFYIVFAVILLVPRQFLVVSLLIWASLTSLIFLFLPTFLSLNNFTKIIASPLSLEFIAGALTAYCVIHSKIKFPVLFLIIGGVCTVFGFLIFSSLDLHVTALSRVSVFLLPMSLLVYGCTILDIQNNLKVPRGLVLLGNWSYSLYLTHYLALLVIRRLLSLIHI